MNPQRHTERKSQEGEEQGRVWQVLAPSPCLSALTSRRRSFLTANTCSLPEGFSWRWKHSWRQLRASRKYWRVNVPGSSPQPMTKRELVDKYPSFLVPWYGRLEACPIHLPEFPSSSGPLLLTWQHNLHDDTPWIGFLPFLLTFPLPYWYFLGQLPK